MANSFDLYDKIQIIGYWMKTQIALVSDVPVVWSIKDVAAQSVCCFSLLTAVHIQISMPHKNRSFFQNTDTLWFITLNVGAARLEEYDKE